MVEDRVFSGEANMRIQAFAPNTGVPWIPSRPGATFADGLKVQWQPFAISAAPGDRLFTELAWLPEQPLSDIATSVRLVGPDGSTWAQPPDERPLGPLFPSSAWSAGTAQQQYIALEIPPGTPPGEYVIELVAYDPVSGEPLGLFSAEEQSRASRGVALGTLEVTRPEPLPALERGKVQFGPLRLLEADTPATSVSAGDQAPVEILWQAVTPPGEPLVVVLQLLDRSGKVVWGVEEEPLQGRYPTGLWEAGEIVRDRHVLTIPSDLSEGPYRLIAGVYRATDRTRLDGRSGLFSSGTSYQIKEIEVRSHE
jgi:hypothetical protein